MSCRDPGVSAERVVISEACLLLGACCVPRVALPMASIAAHGQHAPLAGGTLSLPRRTPDAYERLDC